MKIIVGLGNPGPKYRNSRHNVGFRVVEAVAEHLGAGSFREKYSGEIVEVAHEGERLLLVKPMMYMNNSGNCIAAVARNKIQSPEDLLIVVDDVNLALAKLRLRAGGSAGGHNGLKSAIERLGTDAFHRLRLGVGDDRGGADLSEHVLSSFRPEEQPKVDEMICAALQATLCWACSGIAEASGIYN